jgi:Cu/Ag efflux pump CusA
MATKVLDSWALIAFFEDEPAAEAVEKLLTQAVAEKHKLLLSVVNWGEIYYSVMRGASERLMPILMTATVTALGLLPLALGTGEAGREIEGPMAIVILGGLATSTALNLLVLPTLALRYGRFGNPISSGSHS